MKGREGVEIKVSGVDLHNELENGYKCVPYANNESRNTTSKTNDVTYAD